MNTNQNNSEGSKPSFQRPSSDTQGSASSPELSVASGWASFFEQNPDILFTPRDMGLRGEEKARYIEMIKAGPGYNPSDLILLDESDVPEDLKGRVKFLPPRNIAEIQ